MLTQQEVKRLTLWKWRYSLESEHFTPKQIEHLLFMKWLYTHHRISS